MQRTHKSIFSYEALEAAFMNEDCTRLPQTKGYIAYSERNFIILAGPTPQGEKTTEGKIFEEYGLKFHISVPEDKTSRSLAWDLIQGILIEHQVTKFKVVAPGKKMSDVEGQAGKDITIYAHGNPEKSLKDWEKMLQTINNTLIEHQIAPGHPVVGTKDCPEESLSPYISYRYDQEGRSRQKKIGNPPKWPTNDVCKGLKIQTGDAKIDSSNLNNPTELLSPTAELSLQYSNLRFENVSSPIENPSPKRKMFTPNQLVKSHKVLPFSSPVTREKGGAVTYIPRTGIWEPIPMEQGAKKNKNPDNPGNAPKK